MFSIGDWSKYRFYILFLLIMQWHSHIYAQNIFIIGATGGVGSALIEQISQFDIGDLNHLHPTRILGVANTKRILLADPSSMPLGLSWEHGENIKADMERMGRLMHDRYASILGSMTLLGIKISDIVFVDVTADSSRANLDFHLEVVRLGWSIVTANKNPLALSTPEEFRCLTKDRRRYAYRASVMAGWPAVSELLWAYDTKNIVTKIEGCFSGTLAYICSELEKWIQFSTIVRDAHTKKYTEPNPWDDLSGRDVMRKILILARTAGYSLSMEDIIIEPFIPEEYSRYTGDTFWKEIATLNDSFRSQIQKLLSEGKTLRYIASFAFTDGHPQIIIQCREVLRDSPLGSLNGTHNKVVIETECFSTEFTRPWAGIKNTANSIRVDLADLLKERVA